MGELNTSNMESAIQGTLSEKGKELYGTIFPNGFIPLLSAFTRKANLDGLGITDCYFVSLKGMLESQRTELFSFIAKNQKASKKEVEEYLLPRGYVPVRKEIVSAVSINMRYF